MVAAIARRLKETGCSVATGHMDLTRDHKKANMDSDDTKSPQHGGMGYVSLLYFPKIPHFEREKRAGYFFFPVSIKGPGRGEEDGTLILTCLRC